MSLVPSNLVKNYWKKVEATSQLRSFYWTRHSLQSKSKQIEASISSQRYCVNLRFKWQSERIRVKLCVNFYKEPINKIRIQNQKTESKLPNNLIKVLCDTTRQKCVHSAKISAVNNKIDKIWVTPKTIETKISVISQSEKLTRSVWETKYRTKCSEKFDQRHKVNNNIKWRPTKKPNVLT